MVGSNKILTVSYGTFSCTLEGFDDSFHSMKAIAEYFRDLAQEDRYFGAEPPSPDAEMLARIAEKEISRRVEAAVDGKGIRLRATPSISDASSNDEEESKAEPEPGAEKSDAPEAPTENPVASAENTADKMVVSKTDAPDVATFDDEPEQDAVTMPPETAAPSSVAAFTAPIATPEIATPDADTTTSETQSEPPAHPDANSVAAKLQRIRAVVGGKEKPNLNVTTTATPAVASLADIMDSQDDLVEDETRFAFDALDAGEADGLSTEDSDAATDAKSVEDATSDAATEVETTTALADDSPATDEASFVAEETDIPEAPVDLNETENAAEKEDVSTDMSALDTQADEGKSDLSTDETNSDAAPEKGAESEEETGAKPTVRARIVRLRKNKAAKVVADDTDGQSQDGKVAAALKVEDVSDSDNDAAADMAAAADEQAQIPTVQDKADPSDDIRAAIAAAMPKGSLSDADEDDLQRELASVAEDVVTIEDQPPLVEEIAIDGIDETVAEAATETETSAETGETPKLDKLPEVTKATPKARKQLPEPDRAVSRIIAQTDEALNEPAGSRRRNAIAQLKAAVAATEAARQLGDRSASADDAQEPFRDDLDQAVRASRAIATDGEDAQSKGPRATPLKLVASQRVDANTAPAHDQVAATQDAAAAETGDFAQFAAAMGAKDLPDLLEAAAAYTSFVEGVEDFSRPQIMKKVQLTTTEEFSREDGLRSFGTLLRQGRISKVRNGRFQVSEQTRFRPDARSA